MSFMCVNLYVNRAMTSMGRHANLAVRLCALTADVIAGGMRRMLVNVRAKLPKLPHGVKLQPLLQPPLRPHLQLERGMSFGMRTTTAHHTNTNRNNVTGNKRTAPDSSHESDQGAVSAA